METKHIMVIAIAIAVGAITLSTVLVPAISMGTDTEDTFTNDGYYRMDKITSDQEETLTISWDHTNPHGVTVNGQFVKIDIIGTVSVLADTNFTVRLNVTSITSAIQWYSSTGGAFTASVVDNNDMIIVCENGTATATRGTDTRTGSYDVMYYPSVDGAYVMKTADVPAYMNKDSEIFACGTSQIKNASGSNIGSQALGVEIEGTINDGVTITEWRDITTASTIDTDSIAMDYSVVSNYLDLYKLNKITFNVDYVESVDNETVTTLNEITYSYFIVPYEVTAEKSVHATAPVIQILNMLPIFVALGLIVTVIGVAYVKYRR